MTGNFTLRTKLVFVLGRTDSVSAMKIEEEAKMYNDILLGFILFTKFIVGHLARIQSNTQQKLPAKVYFGFI